MPGRSRGRPTPADRHRDDAYPGYPGYGGHPDDGPGDDGYYDDAPPPARNGRAGPPAGVPARNGSAGPPAAARGPLRPVPAQDEHEPLYARDNTPLGYDGGDPDDPDAPGLLTHGGPGDGGRRNGRPVTGRNGFDRAGFDREGFDRDGFDREGFDRDGFDRDGYDRDGYPADDIDDGYDQYDDAGYDDRDLDDEYDDYDDEYEDDDEDDEEYDDDAYGVGDGPLAVPPPGSNGRPLGPADVEELDPSMTDALARIDLGSMQVPVPFGADLSLEPAEGGRPQAVHLMLPEGRIAVSALAAPRSSGLWAELADEIETSLKGGGARVRSAQGDWGRELHARTENAASVFIGADGPRWMVYGVATAAMETVEALDVELRRVMRGIIVVRGKLPYPPRTVLPLERTEDRDEAENADKPRGASITVSVPASGAAPTFGATPKSPSGAPASNGRPDATTRTPAAPTTRTPAAADGATTRTPAASGRAAAGGAPRNGAARNGVPRNGTGRNGAVPPGPVRKPAPPTATPPAAGPPPAGAQGRPPGRPAPRRPDVPDRGPAPAGRPAANAAGRPAPEDPLDGPTSRTTAAGPVRDAGRRGRADGAPQGLPDDTGSARAPLAAEATGVLRPPAAGSTGPARGRPDAEQTGALPTRRAPAETGSGRVPPEDTGAGRARRDAEDTGARRRRTDDAGARARRDAESTGAWRARRDEETGAGRARGIAEDTGGRRALRDTGGSGAALPPVAPAGSREPDFAPREPVTRDAEPPVTRMLPPVEAPAAGYTGATPAAGPASAGRGELLWSADGLAADDDRGPAEGRARADRFGPADEAPPARRDPAVTSLPSFGADADPARSARRPEPVDESAWTPPSGTRITPPALRPGDDDVTPRGGSRAADPFDGPDPWDAGRDDLPSGRRWTDPDPTPVSRMAIEDIPLSDVPLEEATLADQPEPPRAELPRRRPGGTRRRDVPATDGRGSRRRGPEEDVLSDWMSAEIAARPSGRHASPGHREQPTENRSSGRGLTDWRGPDRRASGQDLFRTAGDDREDQPAEERAERPRRRRGRARTDEGGSRPPSADDPMTLFSAAYDPGRHRR